MTYIELQQLTAGRLMPIAGKNEDGENVVIHAGSIPGREFFLLITAQANGWIRRNYVFADGSAEEFYSR